VSWTDCVRLHYRYFESKYWLFIININKKKNQKKSIVMISCKLLAKLVKAFKMQYLTVVYMRSLLNNRRVLTYIPQVLFRTYVLCKSVLRIGQKSLLKFFQTLSTDTWRLIDYCLMSRELYFIFCTLDTFINSVPT
jgi:hypothetical protein